MACQSFEALVAVVTGLGADAEVRSRVEARRVLSMRRHLALRMVPSRRTDSQESENMLRGYGARRGRGGWRCIVIN